MSTEKIVARLSQALAQGDPLQALVSGLAPTDLQSLMLHVYQQRSRNRSPAELLSLYERSSLLRPSAADARRLADVERAALESAASFEAVDLSPIAPLGLNVALGQINQNNCLATVRNAEVLADPTTAMALEAAMRRRRGASDIIRLCSCSRTLRLQPFDVPGFSPHFDLFAMITAGRDRGSRAFEMQTLRDHIGVHLNLLDRLRGLGYGFADVEVNLTAVDDDERSMRQVQEEVLQPLAVQHPAVAFRIDQSREQGRTYYKGHCIGVYAQDAAGARCNLSDGGFTDWTQRLLSNGKERLFVSAMGIELVVKRFRA